MSHDLIDDLRAEIAKGHVLVVVGAGVSIGATRGNPLASWQGLLENGVERCVAVRGLDSKWADRVREEIRSGDMDDLLSAAEKISSKLGFPTGGEYRRWLRETVGSLKVKDCSVLHSLRDLNLPLATTNYDGLLEEVTGFPCVTWREGDKASRMINQEEKGILHLHGFWDEPESVVLGIRSYERILDDKHAQAVLRALRTLRVLLFVGCGEGLADPNFEALLEWAQEVFKDVGGRHYRLCREEEFAALRALHEDDHLHPLSYGPNNSGLGSYIRGLGSFSAGDRESQRASGSVHPSRLPGRPARCFGREDEVRALVKTLLHSSPPATPILGPPGVGKTTLTLEALHEPRVKKKYGDRRYFVRCDGMQSRDALLTEIGLTLGVESGPELESRVFQELESRPACLLLDNTETPWEADTVAVEDLLTQLSAIEGLALVASIRGDQRPLGPRWREAIRVGPFGLPAARETFISIAGERLRYDSNLERLLEAVDRLPLAVVLMAHRAEGEPDLAGLWKQWQEKRTALLRRADAKERLTNIEVSLDLSVNGPRMTAEARRLLSVLAQLPDGVARDDLDVLMPGKGEEAASVLRKVGLGFVQDFRVRVLAPIREYARRQGPPAEGDLDRAIDHYLKLARQGNLVGTEGGAETAARLVQELGNLESMILQGLKKDDPALAISAAFDFGEFIRFSGWGSQGPLERAMEVARAAGLDELQAACARRLGDIALVRSDHETARAWYEEALPLYRKVGNETGEAICIACMGEIELERSNVNAARARYEEALPLFQKIAAIGAQANCIHSLGNIALLCLDYDVAHARYDEALSLYRQESSVLGEANCVQSLGEIALRKSDPDAARALFEEALHLYRHVGDLTGEANCLRGLGEVALSRLDPDLANLKFLESLSLYQGIQARLPIGSTHLLLARLASDDSEERQSHLRAAREAWESIKRPDLVENLRKEFGEIP